MDKIKAFWKKPEVNKVYTKAEVDTIVERALEKQEEDFDFSQLWTEPSEESGGLMKMIPIGLDVIIIILGMITVLKK